jgi:5-methylcytosine-specific restriction endonuclease McrA
MEWSEDRSLSHMTKKEREKWDNTLDLCHKCWREHKRGYDCQSVTPKRISLKDMIGAPMPITEKKQVDKTPRPPKVAVNNFWQQYKSPLWQRKRLEIMQRDNFTCQSCFSKDATLNVHHTIPYKASAKPWEYEDDELITLCEDCHSQISEDIKKIKYYASKMSVTTKHSDALLSIFVSITEMSAEQLYDICNLITGEDKRNG